MQVSTTIQSCGISWVGQSPIAVAPSPYKGLRSHINRGSWLDWSITSVGRRIPDWTLSDSWVAACEAQGVEPLALIAGAPESAWSINQGTPSIEAIAEYARQVAQRYKGRVRLWQSGNEVDTPSGGLFWGFDEFRGELAGRIHRAVEDAILSVDPDSIVIAPSVQSIWLTGHGLQTLAGMLRGYGGLPRHAAVHVYTDGGRTEQDITAALHRTWGVLESFGKTGDASVQLWATEVGVKGFSALTEQQQGAWLRSALRACAAGGVSRFLHYNFDHGSRPDHFGYAKPRIGPWNAAVRATGFTA